jgi:hypothetical protein
MPKSQHEWGKRGMHTGFWWESRRGRRPLGRPRRRWEDNIKMDLREIGWGGMDWLRIGTNGEPL